MYHIKCNILLYFYKHLFLDSYGLKLELMFIQLYRICSYQRWDVFAGRGSVSVGD